MLFATTFLAFILVFASSAGCGSAGRKQRWSPSPPPTVTVKNGTYSGVYSPGYDQDFFLGMPYAQVRFFDSAVFQ